MVSTKPKRWQDDLVLVRELIVLDAHKYSAIGVDPMLGPVELKPALCTNLYLMTREAFESRFGRESPVVGYEVAWFEGD